MIESNNIKPETFVERVIGASARNKFLVVIFTVFAVAAGVYGLLHTSLDAIPDLSDVQVIIYADWEGRSPDLIEDQITYPISARFISAPKVKFVRGESMFGKSFSTSSSKMARTSIGLDREFLNTSIPLEAHCRQTSIRSSVPMRPALDGFTNTR